MTTEPGKSTTFKMSPFTCEVSQRSAKSAEIQRRARTNTQELLVDLIVTGTVASVSATHMLGAAGIGRTAIEIQSAKDLIQLTPDTVQGGLVLARTRRRPHERLER